MGHHKSRYRAPHGGHQSRRSDSGPYDSGHDAGYGPGWQDRPPRRIPRIVVLGALVLWSLLAWGAWAATPVLLAWLGGLVAPLLAAGTSVAGIVGAEAATGAVFEAANVDGIAGGLLGVLGWLARPLILIGWGIGVVAILAARRLRERFGGLRRLLH